MTAWHQKKNTKNPVDIIQLDEVTGFIDQTPGLRYMVRSLSTIARGCSHYLLGNTILRAIKRGHLDIELWCYVNPLIPCPKYQGDGKCFRTEFESNGRTQSWVIDFDDLENINNIDQLYMAMSARGVPLPYYTTQSGPNNFHCMYRGYFGDWPERKRQWLAEKWAVIEKPIENKDEWNQRIKESGIDPVYFNRTIAKHAIRVAGSLNPNHVIDGQMWRCIGRRNERYVDPHDQYNRECGHVPEPRAPEDKCVTIPIAFGGKTPAFSVYVDGINDLLSELFPDGFESFTVDKLSHMMAQNAGGLARGECRIHQVTWAQYLGCPQITVSRLLKRLIKMGVLKLTDGTYVRGVRSKVYGAGELLSAVIGPCGMPLQPPQWTQWDDGTSHTRMLYDVRYFVSLGMSDDDVIKHLNERQMHRPVQKQRKASELSGCIRRFRKYMRKVKKSQTGVDIGVAV